MRIEEILTEKGMSKTALAEKMNTSRQNINSLLKNPSAKKIEEFAAALDVPVWQLFAAPEEVADVRAVSPENEVCAFVRCDGVHRTADNWAEFWALVDELGALHPRR